MLPFQGGNRVTSPFGPRSGGTHRGIDIVGDDDKTVRAVAAGTVTVATIIKNKNDPTWEWGNYVRVDLPGGEKHYYCHLASRSVKAGDKLAAGDAIGVMGNTGKSFGAHLHFEVRDAKGVSQHPSAALGIPNVVGSYTQGGAAPAPGASNTANTKEEKPMTPQNIKLLEVFGDKNCQTFSEMDVNKVKENNLPAGRYLVTGAGGQKGGFAWCTALVPGGEAHVAVIEDRCRLVETPAVQAAALFASPAVANEDLAAAQGRARAAEEKVAAALAALR